VPDRLDVVLRAARAVVGDVERPAAVGVRAGRVQVVAGVGAALTADEEIVLGDDVVLLPGLVDTHVHLQDPGHPDWEDFGSGTRAAALGGVTTLVDMPLDSVPVTVDVSALAAKRAAAQGRVHVDVGFWGGLVPANLARPDELAALVAAGVAGFKCFLADTGSADFPPVSPAQLRAGLRAVRELDSVLLVHAEDDAERLDAPPAGASYRAWLAARPAAVEERAVAEVVAAVAETGGRAHVVHVSSAGGADLVARARRAGLPITAETCPHYLTLAAADVPDGATAYAVAPPVRERSDAEALWRRLRDGGLDLVVSDHSPAAAAPGEPGADSSDFDAVPPGIASLQLALPVVWTAARARGATLVDVARWMSSGPARLARLAGKGGIAPGRDADFVVLAPDATFTVDPRDLAQRRQVTPYAGRVLRGVVTQTWLAGRPLDLRAGEPQGRLLTPSLPSRASHPSHPPRPRAGV